MDLRRRGDGRWEGDGDRSDSEVSDSLLHDDDTGDEDLPEEPSDSEDAQQFDITLSAEHSYMGPDLSAVAGRGVLEAGWVGSRPALAHPAVLFPGETLPMLRSNAHDAAVLARLTRHDKLFALLCPDESGALVSGYGVLCDVFEAAFEGPAATPTAVSFKARAVHRFRMKDMPKRSLPLTLYSRLTPVHLVVLPELCGTHALRRARLALPAPDPDAKNDAAYRRLDAALSPWPAFVYDMFQYTRLRDTIQRYFRSLGTGLERLMPTEAVALSFWVAGNLAVGERERLALLALDDALLRLHMECRLIDKKSVLCCAACGREVTRREHALAMSPQGAHSTYTNPGGFVHDVVTVSRAANTRAAAPPSAEYSWFPGYAWSVCVCAACDHHVGWRFDAVSRALRPRRFFALCRNYVVPRDEAAPDTPPL